MGVQVQLVLQVGLIVLPYVVPEKRYRHNEGSQTLVIAVDNLQELLLLVCRKLFLEVAHQVLEHVGVLLGCGLHPEGRHEECLILSIELPRRDVLRFGHQLAHELVMLRAVGKNKEFVLRVEGDQLSPGGMVLQEVTPTLQGKDGFDKILPELGIVESPLLLHWEQGKVLHEHPGKDADALPLGHTRVAVHPNPLHS